MKITYGWFLGVVLAAAACGDNFERGTLDAAPDTPVYDPVARGQYIMNVTASCTFCHTPLLPNGTRDQTKLLAGVDCFVDLDSPTFVDNMNGMGCLSTRNLTDHETGLKNATDAQIKNAFLNGVRTDNKRIFPIMPYYIFHNMTDEDADAIVAYLRTVPGVDHTVKANEPPFSLYNDDLPSGFNFVPFLTDTELPMPAGGANNESAMRGRYLAGVIGLCIDCHTPEAVPFGIALDMTKAYAGGKVFPKGSLGLIDVPGVFTWQPNIATRNLTPDTTGLGGWTKDQIKAAIGEGEDRDGNQVCAATHGGVGAPYAALEPQDLDDIAEYLMNIAPIVNDTATNPAAANCGPPPIFGPVESGTDCDGDDDDGDTVPDDGCPYPCGNCAGPPVP
jgi:mono/diheme cytochrome c family protein